MKNKKRVFLIVLDSVGIGEMPDAHKYGDEGSNTLAAIVKSDKFKADNLEKLGFFNIEGVDCKEDVLNPIGSYLLQLPWLLLSHFLPSHSLHF